ncbi:MAG: flagellar hook-length control protein FliK [Burkholderiales bacterium]
MTAPGALTASLHATASAAGGAPARNAAGGATADADALLAALFDTALDAALSAASSFRGDGTPLAPTSPAAASDAADRGRDESAPPPLDDARTARDALVALAGLVLPAMAPIAPVRDPASGAAPPSPDPVLASRSASPLASRSMPIGPAAAESKLPAATSAPAAAPSDAGASAGIEPAELAAAADSPAESGSAERDAAPVAAKAPETPSIATAALAGPTPAPPPPVVAIGAPIDSAAFAPALADEVVRLVQIRSDRVELHVRPAELGPIDVAVSFDGREAQLVVHAAHPDARVALENSLPGLRALLADAGIALSGASIQDGRASRDGQSPPPRDEASPRRGENPAPVTLATWSRRAGAGLVDTYA